MNKIIIGIVTTVAAGLILVATGWNFSAVAEIPEKYVSKEEQHIFMERNDKEHQRIQETVDKIYDHLIKGD